MSSTPPLNNLNSYKIYPNFKQPTPGLSIGQNNGILGFSMATPPPTLNLNEMGFNLPVGFNTMIVIIEYLYLVMHFIYACSHMIYRKNAFAFYFFLLKIKIYKHFYLFFLYDAYLFLRHLIKLN